MKTGRTGYFKTFEEFKKDPTTKIEEVFLKLKLDVEFWFSKGVLSKEKGIALSECNVNTATTQPTLTFEFSSPTNYYEVTLKGDMENLTKDEETKTYLLEIKKFDVNQADLKDRSENEIDESDFNEDYFLQLIAKSTAETEGDDIDIEEDTVE